MIIKSDAGDWGLQSMPLVVFRGGAS